MKVRKVYTTRDADLSHAVTVRGSRVRIQFTGANPSPKRCGTLITEDAALQEAIEADSCFGVLFDLQSETELPDSGQRKEQKRSAVVASSVQAVEPLGNAAQDGTKDGEAAEEPAEELELVANFNRAREYLRTRYEIPMSQMPNTQAVLAVAAELGVVFPNWKPSI